MTERITENLLIKTHFLLELLGECGIYNGNASLPDDFNYEEKDCHQEILRTAANIPDKFFKEIDTNFYIGFILHIHTKLKNGTIDCYDVLKLIDVFRKIKLSLYKGKKVKEAIERQKESRKLINYAKRDVVNIDSTQNIELDHSWLYSSDSNGETYSIRDLNNI